MVSHSENTFMVIVCHTYVNVYKRLYGLDLPGVRHHGQMIARQAGNSAELSWIV
jgi:hypothetical protein